MRPIDAEMLKKLIIKKPGIASEEFLLESEKAVFEEIDKAPTVEVPQWIPVSERLPDFGVDVLVCDGEGVQVTAKRTWWSTDPNGWATNYCGYDYDSWDFMTNGDIVAWMELPKPYEVKEE